MANYANGISGASAGAGADAPAARASGTSYRKQQALWMLGCTVAAAVGLVGFLACVNVIPGFSLSNLLGGMDPLVLKCLIVAFAGLFGGGLGGFISVLVCKPVVRQS